MLAAVLVVGINGVGKKNSVQNFETLHVTRPDAEQNKILRFTAGIDNLYCFSAQFKIHQVFGLRKEKVFCTANSVQSCGTLFPVFHSENFAPPAVSCGTYSFARSAIAAKSEFSSDFAILRIVSAPFNRS